MPQPFVQPDDHALWRFGIISPLLHRGEDAPPIGAQIKDLARRVFYTPQGKEKHLCPDTIRDWLCRYRTMGIDGLRSKPRKDRGSTSVPESMQTALADVRRQQPQWTVKRLLLTLREQGLWDARTPSKSALYRFHRGSQSYPRGSTTSAAGAFIRDTRPLPLRDRRAHRAKNHCAAATGKTRRHSR